MLNWIGKNDTFIKLGDEHVQQQCCNEILLKFIDAPMFSSLTNQVLSSRQSSAIARKYLFSSWCSSQSIKHELCPSLSIAPFQIPNVIFLYPPFVVIIKRIPKLLTCLCRLLKHLTFYTNIHVTFKNSTSANFARSKWKIHLGIYTRRRAADVARYIVK